MHVGIFMTCGCMTVKSKLTSKLAKITFGIWLTVVFKLEWYWYNYADGLCSLVLVKLSTDCGMFGASLFKYNGLVGEHNHYVIGTSCNLQWIIK